MHVVCFETVEIEIEVINLNFKTVENLFQYFLFTKLKATKGSRVILENSNLKYSSKFSLTDRKSRKMSC